MPIHIGEKFQPNGKKMGRNLGEPPEVPYPLSHTTPCQGLSKRVAVFHLLVLNHAANDRGRTEGTGPE